jgi:hypothetical protein
MANTTEVEELVRTLPSKEHFACVIWSTADVKAKAKEMHKRISTAKANDIIDQIHKRHDAGMGITWDTLESYIE